MPQIKLQYYGYHPYNNPTHSERNVELPLAFWFLEKFQSELSNVIEVGEVSPFYHQPRHAVYDVVTELPGTIKKGAETLDYRGKHLLSISTVEHIGQDQYGQPSMPELLPLALNKMLTSKTYLITFALGYNVELEKLVQKERYFIIERTAQSKWRQTANRKLEGYKYHSPYYAGNAICVLTNLEDLHFKFTTRSPLRVLGRYRAPAWSWKNFVRGTLQEFKDPTPPPA